MPCGGSQVQSFGAPPPKRHAGRVREVARAAVLRPIGRDRFEVCGRRIAGCPGLGPARVIRKYDRSRYPVPNHRGAVPCVDRLPHKRHPLSMVTWIPSVIGRGSRESEVTCWCSDAPAGFVPSIDPARTDPDAARWSLLIPVEITLSPIPPACGGRTGSRCRRLTCHA